LAGHVARMVEGKSSFKMLTGKPTGKRYLGRAVLEWILNKLVSIQGIDLIRFRIGILESPCECGIEPPRFISHGVSYIKFYVKSSPHIFKIPN
jgi:hypothetical protein